MLKSLKCIAAHQICNWKRRLGAFIRLNIIAVKKINEAEEGLVIEFGGRKVSRQYGPTGGYKTWDNDGIIPTNNDIMDPILRILASNAAKD